LPFSAASTSILRRTVVIVGRSTARVRHNYAQRNRLP
jgi:hypothetical protein